MIFKKKWRHNKAGSQITLLENRARLGAEIFLEMKMKKPYTYSDYQKHLKRHLHQQSYIRDGNRNSRFWYSKRMR